MYLKFMTNIPYLFKKINKKLKSVHIYIYIYIVRDMIQYTIHKNLKIGCEYFKTSFWLCKSFKLFDLIYDRIPTD
jgi:hypothetical protein